MANASDGALGLFSQPTREWFETSFPEPTRAQIDGWAAIAAGANTLIHAPTGSGKTLAAFLYALDRLHAEPAPSDQERCRVLYISPMKALAYDIDRNLRAPLAGIRNAAGRLGLELPDVTTAMRTGDTPADERRRMMRTPPDVLITTPESLYLMLTSQVREILASVRWVIVDEVHAVAGTKRGSHLALTLERLEELADGPQRIGLSATQRPLEDIARFLGGGTIADGQWQPRPVTVVDAPWEKELDVQVVVPLQDMTRPDLSLPADDPDAPPTKSIWPLMYPRLLELIEQHRSTIVFGNSRGLVERLAQQLNELADREVAQAHHGSLSREQRLAIEDRLKRGELPAVVATSSLELGIDMEAVDLVLLVESPTTVASGLQRVGRAGHQVGAPSRARVFPKHRADLLESAVVVDRMYRGEIEATAVPANPLDVLSQHIVATVAMDSWQVDDLFDLVRRAAPYATLGRAPFEAVLDMLAGRYPSDEFAELRPRLVWDRVDGSLTPRPGAQMLAVTNPGTIPDRGMYRVSLPEGGHVGELDEEMVYESRVGDVITLGSTAWRINEIDHDRVRVTPAPPGTPSKLPFWHGDMVGRPLELGRAIGAFVREIGTMDPAEAEQHLVTRYRFDPWAAANLAAFIAEEKEATGTLPTDRTMVIQRYRDEIGDWRMVLLSPFGARVHAPWSLAASARLRRHYDYEVDSMWTDDGMIFRFPDADEPPPTDALIVEPEELEELVVEEVANSALFASRFREAAGRALLLPRRRPGDRTPLWLQRRRSADLLKIARNYPSFPIVLETYREVLQEHFDLPALTGLLADVRARTVRITDVSLDSPSPFASSLTFDFIAAYMYEYDAPPAERRAAALTLDRTLLAELLGEPELRNLLDPDVVAEVELELQRLLPDRHARSSAAVHDLLRHLGPLGRTDLEARVDGDLEAFLVELEQARQIIRIQAGSDERWAAIEDAARLRDALGMALPQGVPEAFLEPVDDALGDVVGRFARTHGPFTPAQVAGALGLAPAVVTEVLGRLERAGRTARGAFLPAGSGQEWVDSEVLRRLRRRSLAKLRSEVEPVEPPALAEFLARWQQVGNRQSSLDRLYEIVRQLQGASIPASILETDVLPARMSYGPEQLDQLMASGEVVWVGREPLSTNDGRVSLYLREQIPLLHRPATAEPPSEPIHEWLRTHLAERGASFFRDLYEASGGGDPEETLDALWDLVWAGEVTNDTMAPLRAFLWGKIKRTTSARRPRLPSAAPPSGSGRWYLVASLLEPAPEPTVASKALADQLLERTGILTRDVAGAEGVAGGFSAVYPVLRALEDSGRVRRGYFIEGLGGAQFASPGAVDRLRQPSDEESLLLAAADPANPYGAALGWPENDAGRASRSAGAFVITVGGKLVVFVERGARRVLTFTTDDALLLRAVALIERLAARRRRFELETIDGEKAVNTPLGSLLVEAGFVDSYKGLAFRA
ncbi:MAG: DEAD/DEAH box helicase [Acidimicrobiia bacterium]|nr:DEAD/DEAH box helicase [Acidimicrobiia bacterium]